MMSIDKKHDERIDDLKPNKIDADKAQQVKGGATSVGPKKPIK